MALKKKVLWLTVGLVGVMLTAGNCALAEITGSAHDLSMGTSGTNTIYSSDQQEICVFCHTPHNALKNDSIPLWNHELSTQTYGVYGSPTFDGTDIAEIGGADETTATVSNLCMSCHDGTIAINSFENNSNTWPTTTMVGTDAGDVMPALSSANLGTNLGDDHPVNFTYDTTLATTDGSLVDPTDAVGSGLTNAKLFNSKLQCASCHDPHDTTNPTFLRASMDGSGLCKECHTK
ncbi:cytochrome c3 family protein [Thiohalomonas denitrificans]|uniref:cytochrome c3 family protein n=1 Tax=Thiohalomonas denitrificans TaxID=415747 RepID=UPI0026EF1B5A|nr:cytochrome c3 family protein [Thiohalomonas denitrificans]